MKLNTARALRPRARGQRLIKPRIIRTLCIDGRLDPLQPIEFKTHAPKLPAPELKLAHKLSVVICYGCVLRQSHNLSGMPEKDGVIGLAACG